MHLGSTFTISLRALRRNAMRSILTALGMIIGVGAVIVMVTHELDIARFCKRNLIMRDGRVVSDVAVTNRSIADDELRKLREAEAAAKLTA